MASEGLRHPVSDCRSSLASNLPHLWVIEVLACSNRADVSLLLDLVKKTPEILEDTGNNARELVSLRILESFYDQGVRANSVSFTPTKKIGFDPSERCEDVLKRILQETSMSDLKTAGLEMVKWDFQPFIVHKRSSLAKCSLQKLKDAILIGSHPLAASLKEKSALSGGNKSEKVPVEESNDNDITPKPEGSKRNTQIGATNDRMISPSLINCSNPLYKNMTDENLSRFKRKISSTVESDGGMELPDYIEGEGCILGKKSHVVGAAKDGSFRDDNNEHTSLKRHAGPGEVLPCEKQVHNLIPDDTSEEDVGGLNLLANALSILLQNGEGAISGSGKTINVGDRGTNSPSRACNNNQTSTNKSVIGLDVISPCEKQAHHCDTDIPNEAFYEEQEKDLDVKDAEGDKDGVSELKTSEKRVKPQQNILRNVSETEDGNIFCGNDVYYEDMADITRRKNAFLYSQFTHSQDSLENVDGRELNYCMKCNKSGKLLICSSNSCSSAIHESCLGSAAIVEKMEEFHCPFCAYSLALSNYLEAKAKVSLTRKDLAAFLSGGSRKQSKERFFSSYGIIQTNIEQDDDSNKSRQHTGDFGKKVNKLLSREKIGCEEVGPSTSSSGGNPPRKGLASTNELTKDLDKDKQEGEGMWQEYQSPRVHGQNQMAAMANHISQGESTELRSKKEALYPPASDFLSESTSVPINEDGDEISGEGTEDSDFSKYFISIRERKRSSNAGTPQLRRKRVPWTIEEEQTLKNGMERFWVDQNKIIPWKKILDYGENVFHESRTTVDLKDKWRNTRKILEKLHPFDEDAQVA
ncbi:hypothetical protein F511_02183 [Dorcoceras hygrometricum]|uniref:Myb-like domain-containing protein n=1 Tax=Dorcoceras hygrometricum TaxID=472368 RepID=A0A2Z7AVM4_9LAMI|nr:hypothetical protein F511_02183 [Dorcoceras hygrometricum]